MNTQTDQAIARLQRDLAVGSAVRWIMFSLLVLCLLAPTMNLGFPGTIALVTLSIVWLILSHFSSRGTRGVFDASTLIAAGQYDAAEKQLDAAMRGFSIFRSVKLLGLHHLALLRHAQQRWSESAALCQALHRQRLGGLVGIERPSRILFADSLVQMGDLNGAHRAIGELYRHRLSLSEAVRLLVVQLDYESKIGAWGNMVQSIKTKVDMTDLMNPKDSVLSQALLALAARKCNLLSWFEYLRKRVELLAEVEQLTKDRPMLWELWRQ